MPVEGVDSVTKAEVLSPLQPPAALAYAPRTVRVSLANPVTVTPALLVPGYGLCTGLVTLAQRPLTVRFCCAAG